MEKSSSAASKNPHLETKDKSKEMSLYDLCDPAYTLKWKKTNKRKKSDEFTSAVKKKDDKRLLASSAPRPTVNSSVSKSSANVSSSSSGGNRGGGPRVEIINGKIVVKESSLVLQFNQMAEDEYEEVVEGAHSSATYSSFQKRKYSPQWGNEETRLFYQALRQCGTDFTTMMALFPGRTRQQLKKKFFREEGTHPELIKMALNSATPLDLAPFDLLEAPKAPVVTSLYCQQSSFDSAHHDEILEAGDVDGDGAITV